MACIGIYGVRQLRDQEDIHNQCLSKNQKECIKALNQLRNNISSLANKQKTWNDLIKLTNNKDRWVKVEAVSTIGYAFPHMPDKQKAWNDLIKLTNDEDSDVRSKAASAIGSAFFHVPDKLTIKTFCTVLEIKTK